MGKVLSTFLNGYSGAVSRSIDDIIISMKNVSGGAIPFGAPVFLSAAGTGCTLFISGTTDSDRFIGFAVRVPDKTPGTYDSNAGEYAANDPVEILVRGSAAIRIDSAAAAGSKLYMRKSDSKIVASAGAEGTTVELPHVTVRTARDSASIAEVVVTERNIM